jgi:co-chaperonin GroES (HSP10)
MEEANGGRMEKFKMVKYRVRVRMSEGTHDLREATSDDTWEFATRADAEYAAAEVSKQFNDGTWCEPYEVEKRIKPIGDHVVLRVLPKPTRTASGLYLPSEEMLGREDTAEVLAVGSGVKLDDGSPRPGEVVCFDPYKVRLVVGPDGYDVTSSMHARACTLAIVPSSAIRYVVA